MPEYPALPIRLDAENRWCPSIFLATWGEISTCPSLPKTPSEVDGKYRLSSRNRAAVPNWMVFPTRVLPYELATRMPYAPHPCPHSSGEFMPCEMAAPVIAPRPAMGEKVVSMYCCHLCCPVIGLHGCSSGLGSSFITAGISAGNVSEGVGLCPKHRNELRRRNR